MVKLYTGVDASTPGAPLPAGTDILCAYVGTASDPGAPDTPHIWTAAEWNSYIGPDPELRLLPIYVHDYPGDPVADAQNCAASLNALGWAPHIGRMVAVDVETMIDTAYVYRFDYALTELGFTMVVYGSAHFVTQNPPASGYWAAELMPRPPRALPPSFVGIQWKFGADWDHSVFSELLYHNCGFGPRNER